MIEIQAAIPQQRSCVQAIHVKLLAKPPDDMDSEQLSRGSDLIDSSKMYRQNTSKKTFADGGRTAHTVHSR